MPFTIPNTAVASFSRQADPDKVDFDIVTAGSLRTGVVSGCAVTAQGSPDMTLAVASGTVMVAGALATVTGGNVTITTANATNPRFDFVVVNSSGTKSVTAGTAAADPVFPAIPATSVVLAAVYVPATDTAIQSNQIVDKRIDVAQVAFRTTHTWAVQGEIKVPATDVDFIPPMFVSVVGSQAVKLSKVRYKINAGTSVTFKMQVNGGDATGFTAISCTGTAAETDPTDVALVNNDVVAPVVTAVAGTPKNMTITASFDHLV